MLGGPNRCCCGIMHVKAGTTIIATLCMLMSGMLLVFFAVKGFKSGQDEGVAIPYIIKHALIFVAAVLVVVGVWVSSSWMLVPFMFMMFLGVALSILMFILVVSGAALVGSRDFDGNKDAGAIIGYGLMQVLLMGLYLWFFWVVLAAFRYLRSPVADNDWV